MDSIEQRAALERLIRERGEAYAGLSRLIGKNPSYIQQFIKRGSPKKLEEQDRQRLARYFGVSDEELGGGSEPARSGNAGKLIPIPRFDVGASAGPGAFPGEERPIAHIGIDPGWLKHLTRGRSSDLSLIRVQGDSMAPTLDDGDDILVNRAEGLATLRDGIYVLRRDDTLMVKRIAVSPTARRVTIKSDNPAYPGWDGVDFNEIEIIGRVIWAGRRLG